jgi:hypothetical protein
VVGGLGKLLADEPVPARRLELDLGAERRERDAQSASSGSPNAITMSSGMTWSASSRASGAPSPTSPSAGSARLPTITGCTNSTVTWRTSERAAGAVPAAISRPPRANRSAIR